MQIRSPVHSSNPCSFLHGSVQVCVFLNKEMFWLWSDLTGEMPNLRCSPSALLFLQGTKANSRMNQSEWIHEWFSFSSRLFLSPFNIKASPTFLPSLALSFGGQPSPAQASRSKRGDKTESKTGILVWNDKEQDPVNMLEERKIHWRFISIFNYENDLLWPWFYFISGPCSLCTG